MHLGGGSFTGGYAAERSSSSFLSKLKAIDMNPKVDQEYFTKTMSGGLVTIASAVVALLLVLSEVGKW
jgi:hypothetical protein